MSIVEGRDKALIDEWETEMLLKPLRTGEILLYSPALGARSGKDAFVPLVRSIEQAVAESVRKNGDTEVAVVPEGPYVIPLCSS